MKQHTPLTPGIVAGRLTPQEYEANFGDISPRLAPHEASVAANRCYFCYDAPCVTACPTSIDIPLFIRQIATGTPEAAARTILSQNILGGMCARVCPTENLCEGACVRETAEGDPVTIGRLQRYATDTLMAGGTQPFTRAKPTGKRVAVVGGGPAGLSCAHRLALLGHSVTIYEARAKLGGLNEYGIASYKAPEDFAQREIDWLLQIGGIEVRTNTRVESLSKLRDYDAIFLGVGLAGTNSLGLDKMKNVRDAVEFIAELRQQPDRAKLAVGRNVVVIGGGMTAVDAAVQSKLLGAENVTIVYRRTRGDMGASDVEKAHAETHGVRIVTGAVPAAMGAEARFTYAADASQSLALAADQVLSAIGQTLAQVPVGEKDGLRHEGRKLAPKPAPDVWAGGDCAAGGDDLTVTAVAEGRDAAESIHKALMGA